MPHPKPPPSPFKILLCFVTGTRLGSLWEADSATSGAPLRPGDGVVPRRAWEGCSSHLRFCSSPVSAGDLDESTECNFSSFSWILLFCGVEEQSSLHMLLAGAAVRHCPAAVKIFLCWNDFVSPRSQGRAEVKPSVQAVFFMIVKFGRGRGEDGCRRRARQPAAAISSPRRDRRGLAPETHPAPGARGAAQASEPSAEPKPAQACGKLLSGQKQSCPAHISQVGAEQRLMGVSAASGSQCPPAPAWSSPCRRDVMSLGLHWVCMAGFW